MSVVVHMMQVVDVHVSRINFALKFLGGDFPIKIIKTHKKMFFSLSNVLF